jgi:macrodomain Ter protein organizer (MatP/YcbG family)
MKKVIEIESKVWKELSKLKFELEKRTISDTIDFLISFYKRKEGEGKK